jgi:hypothetical protein
LGAGLAAVVVVGDAMSFLHSLHEKMADRFSFIQYPRVRPADARTRAASRSSPVFKHSMPIYERLGLIVISLLMLVVGVGGTLLAGAVVFRVLRDVFS